MAIPLTPESIAKLATDFRARVVSAVESTADLLLARTQEVVPVISGKLKASGRRTEAEINPSTGAISASVIYGNSDAPYAARVHEIPTGQHPKFVERPLMDLESEILNHIADKVKL